MSANDRHSSPPHADPRPRARGDAVKITAMRTGYDADMNVQATFTFAGNAKEVLTWLAGIAKLLADGKVVEMILQAVKKARSIDANSYCWILCQKLAEKLGATKEEIYRQTIYEVGQFVIVPIRADAAAEYVRVWQSRGLGWIAEEIGDSKHDGYVKIMTYFGSSVYNTEQMSLLISELVKECKAQDIETATPAELERMKGEWGR